MSEETFQRSLWHFWKYKASQKLHLLILQDSPICLSFLGLQLHRSLCVFLSAGRHARCAIHFCPHIDHLFLICRFKAHCHLLKCKVVPVIYCSRSFCPSLKCEVCAGHDLLCCLRMAPNYLATFGPL